MTPIYGNISKIKFFAKGMIIFMAKYKRVLLKLSGEALAGEKKIGLDYFSNYVIMLLSWTSFHNRENSVGESLKES